MPVERVDSSPQLGLSESPIKADGLWGCHFLGMARWVYFSSVFGACVLKTCVRRGVQGGGGVRAGSASPVIRIILLP